MYCRNCGNELKENARFCSICGTSINEEKQQVIEIIEEKEEKIESKANNVTVLLLVLVTMIISIGIIVLSNVL